MLRQRNKKTASSDRGYFTKGNGIQGWEGNLERSLVSHQDYLLKLHSAACVSGVRSVYTFGTAGFKGFWAWLMNTPISVWEMV